MARMFSTAERGMALFFASLPIAIPLAFAFAIAQVLILMMVEKFGVGAPGLMPMQFIMTLAMALVVYAHAWFVLILTGWHLRRETPGFNKWKNVGRAAGRGLLLALVMVAVMIGLTTANDAFESTHARTTGDVIIAGDGLFYSWQASSFVVLGRQLNSAIWMLLWIVAIASGAPARLMGGRPNHQPLGERLLTILVVATPWMTITALLGYPSQVCTGECWGFMEGGMIMIPIFALYLFTLSASCASVSAALSLDPANEAQSAQSG